MLSNDGEQMIVEEEEREEGRMGISAELPGVMGGEEGEEGV